MAVTLSPPALAEKASRLVAASERQSFDPFTDVDWSVPLDDSAYYLPPEFLPLYGTAAWAAMTEEERIAYSRHEVAALCSAGIWFENILMHLVLRHLYDLPADDGSHRYLLIETADECRHSAMFGELIRQAGTPAYQVSPLLRRLGNFLKATSRGPESYIAILAAEELLDISNRATMKDDRVHPTSRRIAQIHVLEEARHMSFARTYIAEVWPTLSRFQRLVAMIRAPFIVRGVADALVNPAVYETLGIEDGYRQARKNPVHRERVIRDLGRLTGLLEGIGVINRFTRPVWRALGLVAAVPAPGPS
ncbi:MAG: diiron oxygenase [Acidimicrobiales bacterium]|nr:diiron oxygenase [Acidimicrobiales bacterium]